MWKDGKTWTFHTRAQDASHHRERAGDLDRDVLQIMFAGTVQGDGGWPRFARHGRRGGEGVVALREEAKRPVTVPAWATSAGVPSATRWPLLGMGG